MAWLIALIKGFFSAWLANKTSTAESLGRAKNEDDVLRRALAVSNLEAKAAANAPPDKTAMEKVIAEHKL